MKILIVLSIFSTLLFTSLAFSQDQGLTGEQVYHKTCFACHDRGIAGAPKLGDKTAWAPRIAEGMDEMYHSALHGDGAMPAKGGNQALSDDEVKAAVDFMTGKAK